MFVPVIGLWSCEQNQDEPDLGTKTERVVVGERAALAGGGVGKTDRGPLERAERDEFVGRVYQVSDEAVSDLIGMIEDEADPERRRELQGLVYDGTLLRPEPVRLPLILEMARSDYCDPGLRTTMMAELAVVLQTDHGASWGDWVMALEEHLQKKVGMFPAD